MNKAREWLKGKKAYIMAAIGLVGAVVAWADGQIDTMGLLAAVWAAAQAVFIRAGVTNEVGEDGAVGYARRSRPLQADVSQVGQAHRSVVPSWGQ